MNDDSRLENTLIHQGKTLALWIKDFNNMFTCDLLLMMIRGGCDLEKMRLMGLDEKDFSNLSLTTDDSAISESDYDMNASDARVDFVLYDDDENEVARNSISGNDCSNVVLDSLLLYMDSINKLSKKLPNAMKQHAIVYVNGEPLSPISSIRVLLLRRALNESSKEDEDAALSENDEALIYTIDDVIAQLDANALPADKAMFRVDKKSYVISSINSKGGVATIDLVPQLAETDASKDNEPETKLEPSKMTSEGRNWRNGGYGGTGRSYRSFGELGAPRGKAISWFAVSDIDPKAKGKMQDWRMGPSNFPFIDLLYPERKYKVGTTVLRSKFLKAGDESGVKYIAVPSYLDAVKNNDQDAIGLLTALGIPLDLTFGMDPNDDYSGTYTLEK